MHAHVSHMFTKMLWAFLVFVFKRDKCWLNRKRKILTWSILKSNQMVSENVLGNLASDI